MNIQKIKTGFSDTYMWPCYMLCSGLILLLSPFISMFLAFFVVLVPAYFVAFKIAQKQDADPAYQQRFNETMDYLYGSEFYKPKPHKSAHKKVKQYQDSHTKDVEKRDDFRWLHPIPITQ